MHAWTASERRAALGRGTDGLEQRRKGKRETFTLGFILSRVLFKPCTAHIIYLAEK